MSDVTRQKYRELTSDEKAYIGQIKFGGQNLIDYIDHIGGDLLEFSIAKRRIEEAVMWAVKGITK